MRLIDDWRRTLFGSWSARLGFAGTILGAISGALFVFADELGDGPFFGLVIVTALGSWVCTALVPAARVVKQRKLHDGK